MQFLGINGVRAPQFSAKRVGDHFVNVSNAKTQEISPFLAPIRIERIGSHQFQRLLGKRPLALPEKCHWLFLRCTKNDDLPTKNVSETTKNVVVTIEQKAMSLPKNGRKSLAIKRLSEGKLFWHSNCYLPPRSGEKARVSPSSRYVRRLPLKSSGYIAVLVSIGESTESYFL